MDKMSEQMVLRRQMEKIKQSKTEILECKKYTKSKKKKILNVVNILSDTEKFCDLKSKVIGKYTKLKHKEKYA